MAQDRETHYARTKRLFWPTVMGNKWAWLCLAMCGLAGTGAGTYFSWGHKRDATIGLTLVSLAAGLVLGLILVFAALRVRGPGQVLREKVEALGTAVRELTAKVDQIDASPQERAHRLRVALFAVRSELGACATRIVEALDAERWWDPASDPLPAINWNEYFADLADPKLPTELHAKIDMAYQKCDRLNHLTQYYLDEIGRRPSFGPMVTPKPSPTALHDSDREALDEGLKFIKETNTAISKHLGEAV